jgi:hypothetical protein
MANLWRRGAQPRSLSSLVQKENPKAEFFKCLLMDLIMLAVALPAGLRVIALYLFLKIATLLIRHIIKTVWPRRVSTKFSYADLYRHPSGSVLESAVVKQRACDAAPSPNGAPVSKCATQ